MKRLILKLKTWIQWGLVPLLRPLGFVPRCWITPPRSPLEQCFSTLKRVGYVPHHVLDVGANRGGWSRVALQAFPQLRVTLLEPQAKLKADVEDLLQSNNQVQWFTGGAGAVSGTQKLTLAARDDSSSFRYSADEAHAAGMQQVEVPIWSLDDFVRTHQLPFPDMVKIDAEGIDLAVIEGGTDVLGHAEVVFVEAAVMNEAFSNDLLTVLQVMSERGFRPIDLTDLNRSPSLGCAVARRSGIRSKRWKIVFLA